MAGINFIADEKYSQKLKFRNKMKEETKIILEKMGFKLFAHILWKHEGLGIIIPFEDSTEPYDIAVKIFQQGEKHKIAELKTLLEIN